MRAWVLFCCSFPELQHNQVNEHQKNTPVYPQSIRHDGSYVILILVDALSP